MKGETRLPAVAGSFYPANSDELFESIHRCFTHPMGPGKFPSRVDPLRNTLDIECLLVPHAGYEYSGAIAAHSYAIAYNFLHTRRDEEKSIIVLGPNHYGIGSGVSISPANSWTTPFGEIEVDESLSRALQQKCDLIDIDSMAHSREHSIEVQLPFLQAISRKHEGLCFVPISLMMQDLKTAEDLGNAIWDVAFNAERPFLILASSDLTHYETDLQARKKDSMLLDKVSKLDMGGYYATLQRNSISACGYGAIATVMQIAMRLGRTRGVLLKYATSGDMTGDKSSVVGYPAMRFL